MFPLRLGTAKGKDKLVVLLREDDTRTAGPPDRRLLLPLFAKWVLRVFSVAIVNCHANRLRPCANGELPFFPFDFGQNGRIRRLLRRIDFRQNLDGPEADEGLCPLFPFSRLPGGFLFRRHHYAAVRTVVTARTC